MRWIAPLLLLSWIASSATAVSIDWVSVEAPGNACDSDNESGCLGAVAHSYRISQHEVTNAQYAEFLNAVAADDTHGLYHSEMGSTSVGGITRSGSAGSYNYASDPGRGAMPVNYVTFWDALRFANWLHNGQAAGAQNASTTEGGAYTLTTQGIADNSIVRNAGASIFLPSDDEWYKGAYYDAGLDDYFLYPTHSDSPPTCAAPTATPNHANCDPGGASAVDLVPVGSYAGSASPFGTFDQGGNLYEWTETIHDTVFGSYRGLWGGSYAEGAEGMESSMGADTDPTFVEDHIGFHVAAPIPEPGTAALLAAGLVALAARSRSQRAETGWRRA